MIAWLVIGTIGLGTWAMRASLILLFRDATVPDVVERGFRYVGPAVLAALSVPGLLAPGGSLDLTGLRIPAGIVAGLVAWRTENLLLTLVAGLAVFFGLDAVF
ncbi:MAG: AzlD domain-containing protein [Nitriliruptorales bacterium]|nr:AzlD domain-containing protein [Nitriliruptorales bacterium]